MGNQALLLFLLMMGLTVQSCGGYKAADDEDLEPREGEIVGVLVNENGKANPDSTIELYREDGETPLAKNTGIDSDGRFGVFPPEDGVYSIVGSMGDLDKVIVQGIVFKAGEGMNIGTIQTKKVGGLAVRVRVPEGHTPDGVAFNLIGYEASGTTIEEGAGLIESGIPAGLYSAKFSKDGLETLVVEDIEIQSGEPTVLDDVVLQ
ncbi:hypothetical protein [Oligoflexus tunisiensis]|uniref:hypothetical protein n=1 Tax=Oligoflexus tunisiensis TaxID=708132 RepID=UPI00114CFC91|nr:hypothetical protein [Oligoflexus tunisiensis]